MVVAEVLTAFGVSGAIGGAIELVLIVAGVAKVVDAAKVALQKKA